MSDHPICRGQFQLHIHFHHRYVALFPVRAAPTPEPARVHRNQTLLTADISSSSCLMLNSFHLFVSQPARVVLSSLFRALFSFPFPCLFPAPLPGSHSSHLAHRRSTHPHSYLFYHLCLPRRKVNFSGLHLYPPFDPLICIAANTNNNNNKW